MIKNNEDKNICKECGGNCCKSQPCAVFPEEFNEITVEILISKIKSGFTFDYWEGPTSKMRKNDCRTPYFMRPRASSDNSCIVNAAWHSECIFLTNTGCKLSWDERPLQGRAVIPKRDFKCGLAKKFNKESCCNAWLKYNDIIVKTIRHFQKENIVYQDTDSIITKD